MDNLEAKRLEVPDAEVGVYLSGIPTSDVTKLAIETPIPSCYLSDYDEIQVLYSLSKHKTCLYGGSCDNKI